MSQTWTTVRLQIDCLCGQQLIVTSRAQKGMSGRAECEGMCGV